MHAIIDSPYNLGDFAARLHLEGVRTVIRYYNNRNSTTFPSKCLSVAEKDKLLAAGLTIATVFQQRGGAGGHIEDLSAANGTRDGSRAVALAAQMGQPEGSAIYFGVDHDFARTAELNQIVAYFRAVSNVIGGRFRIGVYGSGAVCSRLKSEGLAELFWLPASMGWLGSRDFLASQQWTIFQKFQELQGDFGHFDYDGNVLNPTISSLGEWGSDGAMRGIVPRPADPANSVAMFQITARRGLNLRSGPGEQFSVNQTIGFGKLVHGLGREGNWIKVDVNGDGIADGFMARDFLKALSGGLPLPPPPTLTPFAVAQRELALGVAEIAGAQNNPRIVLYHSTTADGAASDETAWCSSFANFCVEQAGMHGTDSKAARSWHNSGWGHDVTSDPRPGDLVVWRRRSPRQDGGHVGFFIEALPGDKIRVLGGNQGNRVSIADFPRHGKVGSTQYDLLSIRR